MPTTASTKVGYVLICSAALLGILYLQKKTSAVRDDDDDDKNGSDNALKSTDTDDVIGPFPWEPKLSKDSSSASAESNKTDDTRKRHHITRNQNQELDFLASMTFANGGLRAHSCPCCV